MMIVLRFQVRKLYLLQCDFLAVGGRLFRLFAAGACLNFAHVLCDKERGFDVVVNLMGRKNPVVVEADLCAATARLAVALSREIDGKLMPVDLVAREACAFVAAAVQRTGAGKADAMLDLERIAALFGATVSPGRGRSGIRLQLESGKEVRGLTSVFTVG